MSISIYGDKELFAALEKIKETDPLFNLSAYVKECLINYSGTSTLDESEVVKKKRDIDLKIQDLKNEIEYWDNKMIDIKMYKERERDKKEEMELTRKREEEKDLLKRKMIMSTFLEELGREMTEEEYQRYALNPDIYVNIWAFIDKFKIFQGEKVSKDGISS